MKILVTGGAGFIGSVMVGYLNSQGITPLVADDISAPDQYKNLVNKLFTLISIEETMDYVMSSKLDGIIHLGAITDTMCRDWDMLYTHNVQFTRNLAIAAETAVPPVPLVFASSASVVGNGDGPLNEYAFSKTLSENDIENSAICLRLFNVYGPNEYHKDRMASTIMHWYGQLILGHKIRVFTDSHTYCRDFIYVEDVCAALYQALKAKINNPALNGVWDLGTGVATSFIDVANTVIECFGEGEIKFIDMPEDLAVQYQTTTQADVSRLGLLGIDHTKFLPMREGVAKYCEYLAESRHI
jgi:ADP-L-glycero-D-manno-heptose 6-epimerase